MNYPISYLIIPFVVIDLLLASGATSVLNGFMAYTVQSYVHNVRDTLFMLGLSIWVSVLPSLWAVGEIFKAIDPEVKMVAYEMKMAAKFPMEKRYPELPPDPVTPIINVPMLDEKEGVVRGLRFHGIAWKDWVKTCKAVRRANFEFKIGTFAGIIGGRRLHDTFRPLWLKLGVLKEKGEKEVELTREGETLVRRISKLPHDLDELPIFLASTVGMPAHTQHTQAGGVV